MPSIPDGLAPAGPLDLGLPLLLPLHVAAAILRDSMATRALRLAWALEDGQPAHVRRRSALDELARACGSPLAPLAFRLNRLLGTGPST